VFELQRMALHVDASIGVALSPQHATDVNGLLQRADIALYAAKANRGGFAVYDSAAADPSADRLRTVEELRTALASDQLVLHYQPKVTLPDGHVGGVEALVRWWHPDYGLRYPDAFLPLIEEAGLMALLSDRVLALALDQIVEWREEGLPPITVAVNLSASSTVDAGLPARVGAALAERGLPGTVLALEITEQFLMADRVRARAVLTELRSLGVTISIDDFGTGYSSLAYLRDLPVDELKLDRAFVAPLADDARAANLVRSTIDLAHSLGLRMVAEGVEDQATADELARYGCDLIQGFHLGRPMPAAQLGDWLEQFDRARVAVPSQR
jgi:EAL domain-containing protein (putative c-di-GMP-specific phosphodiesterase class I)